MSTPESVESPPEQPAPARPSLAQILASVLTAVTTTFALSYLGVAGTIIGAGLASTFTVLANYWYTRSILHTQRKVNQLAPKVVRSRPGARTEVLPRVRASQEGKDVQDGRDGQEIERTQVSASDDEPAFATSVATAPVPVSSDSGEPADPHALMAPARAGRRRFLVPILAVFVLLLLLITAIELGLGKPISDALRGQEGSGTSVFHNRTSGGAVDPEPTSTEESGPTEAPSSEPGQTPSEESTTEPVEPTPSEEPSSGPATTPEPSAPEPTEPPAAPQTPADPPVMQEPEAEGSVEPPDVDPDAPQQPTVDESQPAVDARNL